MAMNWSREKPTRAGWYWVHDGGQVMDIVRVLRTPGSEELEGRSTGGGAAPISKTSDYWWMGPLPVPEPPEDQA